MIFLFLATMITSVFSLGYKIANHQGCNLISVNALRNFVALLVSAVVIVLSDSFLTRPEVIGISLFTGVCIFIAILSFFYVIQIGELSVSWTMISLGLVIPFFASVFIWNEIPNFRQILGIVAVAGSFLSFAALKGTQRNRDKKAVKRWWLLVLVAFFTTGLAMIGSKMLVEFNLCGEKWPFVFYINLWVFILSALLLYLKGYLPRRRDFFPGALMGIAGPIAYFLFLVALEKIPGIIAFPVRGAGTLILTALFSAIFWKERIGIKGLSGIIFAILAIILISS